MSSKPTSPDDDSDHIRSASSSISSKTSLQQQRMEAALTDLESSFDRSSHSVRYTSHVLDIQTGNEEDDEDVDDVSSMDSRRSANTAQWFLSDEREQGR